MRTALTLGLIAGSEVREFIAGPETDIQEQRIAFKDFKRLDRHAKYGEVQLWESGTGIVSRRRFKDAAPPPAKEAATPPPPAEPEPPEPSAQGEEPESEFAVSGVVSGKPAASDGSRRRKR